MSIIALRDLGTLPPLKLSLKLMMLKSLMITQ